MASSRSPDPVPEIVIHAGPTVMSTLLGQGPPRLPTGGKIRAGISQDGAPDVCLSSTPIARGVSHLSTPNGCSHARCGGFGVLRPMTKHRN